MTIGASGISGQTTSADNYGPVLQDANGIYYGSTNEGSLSAFDQSGNVLWSVPGFTPLMLTAYGEEIASNGAGQIVTFDANGNTTGQLPTLATQSWTDYQYGSVDRVTSLPVYVDGASFAPQLGGNPSENGTPILQCPCLVQSSSTAAATISANGTQNSYLILSGDPGLNLGPGHNHSVGRLFDLAAETFGDGLVSSGNNTVVTTRISSASDFANALTSSGSITGGVTYFGHAGIDRHGNFALFAGQNPGDLTNVTVLNVNLLQNTQLGPSVTITLNACHAGYGGENSIAQVIANRLRRTVFAYPVDMYFSSSPVARPYSKKMVSPENVPVYMVPNGNGIQPIAFAPH
jgi:hypothetical protein